MTQELTDQQSTQPGPQQMQQTHPEEVAGQTGNLDVVMRIPVSVQVILGAVTMPVANLVKMGQGAVIALDRSVGEPVDVVINGRVVARGQIVTTNENNSRFGVSLTEMVGIEGPVQGV